MLTAAALAATSASASANGRDDGLSFLTSSPSPSPSMPMSACWPRRAARDRLSIAENRTQTRPGRSSPRRQLTAEQMARHVTVTNLACFGIDAFTPIIQLPQCAVLAWAAS